MTSRQHCRKAAIENNNTYRVCIHTRHLMKHLNILIVLLLAVSMAASGCTSTTADPISTANYAVGDVMQSDPSDEGYLENGAIVIVGVSDAYYTFEIVVRESPAHAWIIYGGHRAQMAHADLEYYFPRHIDQVDVSTLATWTATPTPTNAPTQTPTLTQKQTLKPTPTKTLDTATLGEKNAVDKAKSYLRVMAFSREGLIDQLEFEGFSHTEAVYGVDHVGANWNEQAAKKAESYLKIMSFSRSGLIDQLEFEGFTPAQAEYGVRAVGY